MSDRIPGQAARRRRPDERRPPGDVGEEPDPRFTYANERTFLAWTRTALALVAAGAAAATFLDAGPRGLRLLVALPLIAAGGALGVYSYRRWEENERAMRLGDPLRYSDLPRALAYGIAVVCAITAVVVVVELLSN
jgi:putative membrane protein